MYFASPLQPFAFVANNLLPSHLPVPISHQSRIRIPRAFPPLLQTRPLWKKTYLDTLGVRAQQTRQTTIQARRVHVAAPQHRVGSGQDGTLVVLGRDTQKGLFDRLVRVRLGAVQRAHFVGNVGKDGVGGVAQVVVVKETGVALLDELGVGPCLLAFF